MTARTNFADRLYAALPTVYRTRDKNGVLACYFGACGDLLDALRQTLVQRYADIFPDSDGEELACQDWILPYLADLLAVRLVSPEAEGRRQEVNNAVAWRQRKGTRRVAEWIAEAVGQFEIELIEGWQKVAVTASIDSIKLPATTYGVAPPDESYNTLAWRTTASMGARHPTLLAGTVDLRCPAGAVSVPVDGHGNPLNQAARRTRFPGAPAKWWRQASLHGVPCKPGAFDDPSRRTADIRTPRWDRGHALPRRLLLFVPPAAGLCETPAITLDWSDRGTAGFSEHVSVTDSGDMTEIRPAAGNAGPTRITGDIRIKDKDTLIEGLCLEGAVSMDGGVLRLQRVAVQMVRSTNGPTEKPAVYAEDSIIGNFDAIDRIVQLVYATVLTDAVCGEIRASDSIFMRPITDSVGSAPSGCIRYSRVHSDQDTANCSTFSTTTRLPLFFSSDFGTWGCCVLHPASPRSVLNGAEDGGELGAHHHRRYVLRGKAVLDKLAEYLPLDITPVLVPDAALLEPPT